MNRKNKFPIEHLFYKTRCDKQHDLARTYAFKQVKKLVIIHQVSKYYILPIHDEYSRTEIRYKKASMKIWTNYYILNHISW